MSNSKVDYGSSVATRIGLKKLTLTNWFDFETKFTNYFELTTGSDCLRTGSHEYAAPIMTSSRSSRSTPAPVTPGVGGTAPTTTEKDEEKSQEYWKSIKIGVAGMLTWIDSTTYDHIRQVSPVFDAELAKRYRDPIVLFTEIREICTKGTSSTIKATPATYNRIQRDYISLQMGDRSLTKYITEFENKFQAARSVGYKEKAEITASRFILSLNSAVFGALIDRVSVINPVTNIQDAMPTTLAQAITAATLHSRLRLENQIRERDMSKIAAPTLGQKSSKKGAHTWQRNGRDRGYEQNREQDRYRRDQNYPRPYQDRRFHSTHSNNSQYYRSRSPHRQEYRGVKRDRDSRDRGDSHRKWNNNQDGYSNQGTKRSRTYCSVCLWRSNKFDFSHLQQKCYFKDEFERKTGQKVVAIQVLGNNSS